MTKSNKESSEFLDALLSWRSNIASTGNAQGDVVSASILSNFTSLQNDKATGAVMERYIKQLEETDTSKQSRHETMLGLLHTPTYLLSRRLRERIVSVLLPREELQDNDLSLEEAVLLLDLLIHVTRERGFGVSFTETPCLASLTVDRMWILTASCVSESWSRTQSRLRLRSPLWESSTVSGVWQ